MGARGLGKVIRKAGEDGLIYCSGEIAKENYYIIPGTSGHEFFPDGCNHKSGLEKMQTMFQNTLIHSVFHLRRKNKEPSVCYIREGPYAIPIFRKSSP
jgi:hypothetical protein